MVGFFFATNAKMVLINDDQWIIAHIVLDVWVTVKNLNNPNTQQGENNDENYKDVEVLYFALGLFSPEKLRPSCQKFLSFSVKELSQFCCIAGMHLIFS